MIYDIRNNLKLIINFIINIHNKIKNMNSNCFQCGYSIKRNDTIYRYCDATLCSIDCKIKRSIYISELDPYFKYPEKWLLYAPYKYIPPFIYDENIKNRNMIILTLYFIVKKFKYIFKSKRMMELTLY